VSILTSLKVLNLALNYTVSDAGVRNLAGLTSLNLWKNDRVTDVGLALLTGAFPPGFISLLCGFCFQFLAS
jgi:hypothetical protein